MNTLIVLALTAAAFAQPAVTLPPDPQGSAPPPMLAAPAPPAGDPAPADEVTVEVIAVKGARKGVSEIQVDEELKPLREVLESLKPNDSFELIARDTKMLPYAQETQYVVNGLYTAHVTAHGGVQTPEGGQRFDLEIRVEDLRSGNAVDALRVRGEAAPREAIVLRGMPLGQDEMALLVVVVPPPGEQSGDSQGEQPESGEGQQEAEAAPQEQESGEEEAGEGESPPDLTSGQEEGEGNADGEREGEEGSAAEVAQESAQEGEQAGEPKDMETIKALLESLEQKDREEQRNAHHRRSEVKIRGDWW